VPPPESTTVRRSISTFFMASTVMARSAGSFSARKTWSPVLPPFSISA